MGDETKRKDGARPKRSEVFTPPPWGIEDEVRSGGEPLLAASLYDLCAYRTAYSALSSAMHEAREDCRQLTKENEVLRRKLQESRDRCGRMSISMQQQTADAAALKAKVEDMTGKLAMIKAARELEAKPRKGTRR